MAKKSISLTRPSDEPTAPLILISGLPITAK